MAYENKRMEKSIAVGETVWEDSVIRWKCFFHNVVVNYLVNLRDHPGREELEVFAQDQDVKCEYG